MIEDLLSTGQFRLAEERSKALADIAIRASSYFQKSVPEPCTPAHIRLALLTRSVRYDWFLLCTIVTLGYTGFMAYTALAILADGSKPNSSASSKMASLVSVLPVTALIFLTLRFVLERAPITYYLYAAFPAFFWHRVLRERPTLVSAIHQAQTAYNISLLRFTAGAIVTVLAIEAMAYGYCDRRAFTALAYGMGMIWPAVMLEPQFKVEQEKLLQVWRAAMAVLGVFPLLPVEKGESLITM